MQKRMFLAVVLGAVGMFLWTSMAHMVLPLGEAGVGQIANEQPLLASMQATLGTSSGLYLFPAIDASGGKNAGMQDYAKKVAANPSGVLIYHPPGNQLMTARMLSTEFLVELLEALIAVLLVARSGVKGFAGPVGFITLIGLAVALWTNTSYWNWYGFPSLYTVAYIATQIIAFVILSFIAAGLKVMERPMTV